MDHPQDPRYFLFASFSLGVKPFSNIPGRTKNNKTEREREREAD